MKTELSPESEAEKSRRWMEEVISPEEQAVSEMTDELFKSRGGEEGQEQFDRESSSVRRTDEKRDFRSIGQEGVDNEDRDEVGEGSSAKSVQIGSVRKANLVSFTKLNDKAFKVDVISTLARLKMN